MKKIISVVLAAVMLASLLLFAGCGKKTGNSGKEVETKLDKDHIFSEKQLTLPENFTSVSNFEYGNGMIYLYSNSWDGMTDTFNVGSINIETGATTSSELDLSFAKGDSSVDNAVNQPTTDEEAVTFEEELDEDFSYDDSNESYSSENVWVNASTFDEEGNLYAVINYEIYGYDAATDSYNDETTYYLCKFDIKGNTVWYEEYAPEKDDDSDYNYVYVRDIDVFGDTLAVYREKAVDIISISDGSPIKTIDAADYNDISFLKIRDNKCIARSWDSEYANISTYAVDINTGKIGDKVCEDNILSSYTFYGSGIVYDLLLECNGVIYGYNLGDAEPTAIMNLLDSNVYTTSMDSIAMVDKDTIIASYYNYDEEGSYFSVFTKVDPATIPDKKAISLVGVYLDSDVAKRVVDFNKSSNEYHIQVTDYSQYASYDDWKAAYTKLNTELASGNVPDIIVVNTYMPFNSYINKGLIEDLNPFFDKDETINREDFLTNIFDAYSVDGKLYSIAPGISIETLVGRTSDIGEAQGWTMDEFISYISNLPEDEKVMTYYDANDFLYSYLYVALGDYVDASKGTCTFDDGRFAKMLAAIKDNFPKEFNYNDITDEEWNEMNYAYRNHKAALNMYYMSDFRTFARTEQGDFGEAITLKGFPCEGGNGAVVISGDRYAISSTSAAKDGCWEFVKGFLADEYQESFTYRFPIKVSALEKLAETAQQQPYWEYDDGTIEYYDDTYWVGDSEITINPLTKAETNKLIDYIKSVNKAAYYDENITTIVNEEAQAFFEGQKSAEDVCSLIQSRVSLYISELN